VSEPDVIEAVVDSHIHVSISEIEFIILDRITDELTVVNRDREYAERTQKWGWEELPEFFELFDIQGDELIMPRGYALQFKLMLREHGCSVRWRMQTKYRRGEPYGRDEFEYRVHQPAAVRAMKLHHQGIYKAPTGSGKTAAILGYLWETHPEKAVILVDRKALVKQWAKRIHKHIGEDVQVGQIAEGKRTDGRIVVATLQACHRAIQDDEDWVFDLLTEKDTAASVVVVDECHHVPARSFRQVVDRSVARERLGTSATPGKGGEERLEVAQAILGEIIHEDSDEELKRDGVIGDPRIEVIRTDFDFVYWGDHQSDADGECDVPDCGRTDRHRHRNNYTKTKQALVRDFDRNNLIAKKILEVRDSGLHHQLVISNEVTPLNEIMPFLHKAMGREFDHIVRVLKGKMTEKQQQEVIEEIEASDESITLSTIASEGLDFAFDRGHLIFPTGDPEKTKQEIGRFRRVDDAVIYDYADTEVKVFAKQFRNRRYKCYDALGLEVVM
jgi:superfamily II DNA or RNA helicase